MTSLVAAGIAACLAAGCAEQSLYVDVDSKPTGAMIYVDGEKRGLTRSRVRLDFDGTSSDRVLIQIVKPRYKPVMQYWTMGEVPEGGTKVFVLEVD